MSDYISKSGLIEEIERQKSLLDKSYDWSYYATLEIANIFCKIINKQPTLDEKEIIRNAAKRIIDRLEYQKEQYESRAEKFAEALNSWEESRNRGKAYSYGYAIEIVKEECGISE